MIKTRLLNSFAFIVRWKKLLLSILAVCIIFMLLLLNELRTSRLQAYYFASVGRELTYQLKPGPSQRIRFPQEGPHDIRLGYTRIGGIVRNLTKEGFLVEAQAEISEKLADLIDHSIFPIYHEKTQAGLKVLDQNNDLLYAVSRPERIYPSFESIPNIVAQSILFIENREILDPNRPYRNPAVEWDRLGKAIFEKFLQIFIPSKSAPGGSTIATQLEKYLHGFEGRTRNISDKYHQMLSASYRAYLDGEKTFKTRENIVLNYINSIPLAALPGYGEVNGLGDGLWAWYGLEVSDVNQALGNFTFENAKAKAKELAPIYKKVLSLFIAHRRPSYYLLSGQSELNSLTDEHLHLLTAHNLIPAELRDEALKVKLELKRSAPPPPAISFVQRKAANAIRTRLLKITKFRQLYDLDQVDLTVKSSLNKTINLAVSQVLTALLDKKNVAKFGLVGDRTLGKGDPSKVVYSVTLYERVNNVNLLRIQTDNLERPFDINEGTRLDLGSTAKLRVLANYLEIIADLYESLFGASKKDLEEVLRSKPDQLSKWVAQSLLTNPKITLTEVLQAAMQRQYSASPAEQFFTGGGMHSFVNFKKEDNGKIVTVQEALRHSVNLPFIRIIRDNLRYYMAQLSDDEVGTGNNPKDLKRSKYLAKFADKEGSYFLRSFYQKYRGHTSSEIVAAFVKSTKPSPKKLAVIFRHIRPDKSVKDFGEFVSHHLPSSNLSDKVIQNLYDTYAPGKFSLNDQGFLARVHPLELWLVGYMVTHPDASFNEIQEASIDERQHVYEWLIKKGSKRAQDVRIKTLIEAEAFLEMHRAWRRLGYPFQSMVPSYASAIGSSGDRPAALAELIGIIVNDGMRLPTERMERLHFAAGTPFETILSLDPNLQGERVMKEEVAKVLKVAVRDVVENGTARRVDKSFKKPDGTVLAIGGKTGTGDHRYETFGKGGQMLSSRVVNRTATFVFYIGDRFFGTVTAHVHGPEAANYNFTSALAAELLKILAPSIEPLVVD